MEKTTQVSEQREYAEYLYSRGGATGMALRAAPVRYVPPMPPTAMQGADLIAERVPAGHSAMVRTLRESIKREVVVPILGGATREECLELVGATWHSFCETLRALHVLIARASSERKAIELADQATQDAYESIRRAARGLVGPAGEHEADFALSTYESARAIAVGALSRAMAPAEAHGRDSQLARTFNDSAAFHMLGCMLITVAAEGGRHSKESVSVAFELLRGGALEAYAAVREAYDLRHGEDETPCGDDEDLIDPLSPPHAAAPAP